MQRRARLLAGSSVVLCLAAAGTSLPGLAQQASIGIAPVTLKESSYTFDTAEQHGIRVVAIAKGLPHPFSVAFLPNGDALVVERGARLRLVRNAANGQVPVLEPQPVAGVPAFGPASRNAGLHEIVLHPKFAENRLVYFTYNKSGAEVPNAKPPRRLSALTLGRARFDGKALTSVEDLFVGEWSGASGSRLAFGRDGLVYITTGAPFGEEAQDTGNVYGKVLRLRDDGKVPPDNPFVGRAGFQSAIFSLGHRDQLGLTVHPTTGAVLSAEHGPNGGDEINVILPGRNYGWPRISFGHNYDGPPISAAPVEKGIQDPLVVWLPSIAPTGLTFYTGDRFPSWKGNLFVGSARRGQIPRTGGLERVVLNDKMEELRRETLLTELHQRVRDVRQGPDGLLYVLTDEDDGALLRIEPTGK